MCPREKHPDDLSQATPNAETPLSELHQQVVGAIEQGLQEAEIELSAKQIATHFCIAYTELDMNDNDMQEMADMLGLNLSLNPDLLFPIAVISNPDLLESPGIVVLDVWDQRLHLDLDCLIKGSPPEIRLTLYQDTDEGYLINTLSMNEREREIKVGLDSQGQKHVWFLVYDLNTTQASSGDLGRGSLRLLSIPLPHEWREVIGQDGRLIGAEIIVDEVVTDKKAVVEPQAAPPVVVKTAPEPPVEPTRQIEKPLQSTPGVDS